MRKTLERKGVNSVCVEAECPNKVECWARKHVTYMILGSECTRGCSFCGVKPAPEGEHDEEEAGRIAASVKELAAEYVVITSVTRDDLDDMGANHFKRTIDAVKKDSPEVKVEILIPDMNAEKDLLEICASSASEVIGHNIEMPQRLYEKVRPRANYARSLKTLRILNEMKRENGFLLKSSMILGLGEAEEEITATLKDLYASGVDIVYMGQYLSPSSSHWPVKKYYTPEEFNALGDIAGKIGFKAVCSAPLVRSSYRAYEAYKKASSVKREASR